MPKLTPNSLDTVSLSWQFHMINLALYSLNGGKKCKLRSKDRHLVLYIFFLLKADFVTVSRLDLYFHHRARHAKNGFTWIQERVLKSSFLGQ